MALKTAIYMRVSTQDQCVDSQRQELLKFIEKRDDLELAGEYADVISGVREKRAELDRLIIDSKQRKIDAVLFFDLTRLTRKGIGHAIKILGDWKDAKVKPICYAYPMLDFTDDSGMGEMMAAMMAWMAAQERQMIQKRIRAGLAARKAKGGRLGRAPLPRWDGRDDAGRQMASGVYLYRLEAPAMTGDRMLQTRKLLLLR